MATYTMSIDGGAGGEDTCEADSLAEALEQACDWARGDDWDTSSGTVYVRVDVRSTVDWDEIAARAADLLGVECAVGKSAASTYDDAAWILRSEAGDDEGAVVWDEAAFAHALGVDEVDVDEDGDMLVSVAAEADYCTASIEADEPSCRRGGEHEWESPHWLVGGIKDNPGVVGHGGGVLVHEACLRCGGRRTTDTWAQNPQTGEQGLTSVSYDEGYYDLPEWGMSIDEEWISAAEDAGACEPALAWLREEPRTVGELREHCRAWYRFAVCEVYWPAMTGDVRRAA